MKTQQRVCCVVKLHVNINNTDATVSFQLLVLNCMSGNNIKTRKMKSILSVSHNIYFLSELQATCFGLIK